MKNKMIGILVVTLLISTVMTTIAANENDYKFSESISYKPVDVPDSWLEGADQYQTERSDYGFIINPEYHIAQEFKPTKEDLTAVALHLFDWDAPSDIEITVHIRESLDGDDLTTITREANVKDYSSGGGWVMFNFDDISLTPEESYYIICYADGGIVNNSYCWYFVARDKYDRGIAWESNDSGISWSDLEDPWNDPLLVNLDLCFITYYQEPPRNKVKPLFQSLLEELSLFFPFLTQFLDILG